MSLNAWSVWKNVCKVCLHSENLFKHFLCMHWIITQTKHSNLDSLEHITSSPWDSTTAMSAYTHGRPAHGSILPASSDGMLSYVSPIFIVLWFESLIVKPVLSINLNTIHLIPSVLLQLARFLSYLIQSTAIRTRSLFAACAGALALLPLSRLDVVVVVAVGVRIFLRRAYYTDLSNFLFSHYLPVL